jgi:hypothetical protein
MSKIGWRWNAESSGQALPPSWVSGSSPGFKTL